MNTPAAAMTRAEPTLPKPVPILSKVQAQNRKRRDSLVRWWYTPLDRESVFYTRNAIFFEDNDNGTAVLKTLLLVIPCSPVIIPVCVLFLLLKGLTKGLKFLVFGKE